MPDQPTMNFAAGEGVLRHVSYCRTCHAREQECTDHTNGCSNCFGTFDRVSPLMFDPVSVEAGNTSEKCPWSASGKTNHGGVYIIVAWTKD
jgi:hypothetical protein